MLLAMPLSKQSSTLQKSYCSQRSPKYLRGLRGCLAWGGLLSLPVDDRFLPCFSFKSKKNWQADSSWNGQWGKAYYSASLYTVTNHQTIRNFPVTHICFLSALPCLVWGREVSFQFWRLNSQSRISASLPNHQHIYLLCNKRHRAILSQTRAVWTHCIFPSLPIMTHRSSKISDMKQVRSNFNERDEKVKDPLGAKVKKRRQKSGFEWTEKSKKADRAS